MWGTTPACRRLHQQSRCNLFLQRYTQGALCNFGIFVTPAQVWSTPSSTEGWLAPEVLHNAPVFPDASVDYEAVIPWKGALLRQTAAQCVQALSGTDRLTFEAFCAEQHAWLGAFAKFMALKDANAGLPWTQWTHRTDPDPVAVAAYKFLQWQFFRQWQALKQYCHDHGVRLIGDLPIYVAHDSADVWGHPASFALDGTGQPTEIVDVPLDCFSTTGQR